MLKRKGQSTLEYALIIAVVVAGLLLMQYYVKRGYSGRLKSASDEMGEQFDPSAYTGNFDVNQTSKVRQTVTGGETKTEHLAPQTSTRTGTEKVAAWGENDDLFKK